MNAKEEGGEDEILAKTATTERKQMKRKERRIGRFSSLVAGLFTEAIFIVVALGRGALSALLLFLSSFVRL
tara:strand:- start:450 stop:662 length:213 start_codon:yes stop_codon:yes gene_type:complete